MKKELYYVALPVLEAGDDFGMMFPVPSMKEAISVQKKFGGVIKSLTVYFN